MKQLSELKEADITIQVLQVLECLVGESSYHQLLEQDQYISLTRKASSNRN